MEKREKGANCGFFQSNFKANFFTTTTTSKRAKNSVFAGFDYSATSSVSALAIAVMTTASQNWLRPAWLTRSDALSL